MSSDDALERVEELQSEIQELLSETDEDEGHVEEDLRTLEDKVEYLKENAIDAREPDELEDMTSIFIEACHHLIRDVRAEKEINQELEQLENDEENYIALMNRIQDTDMPEDRRQRIQRQVGKISKEEIESALEEDRRLKRREVHEIRELIDDLSEAFKDISHNLKGRRMRSQLKDAREAWIHLTHVEGEV